MIRTSSIPNATSVRECGSMRRSPAGFTLLEILTVLIIILILASLLLPAVQQAREAARRMKCQNHLMQMGVALNNYMMAHEVLPPGTTDSTGPIVSQELGGYHMSWMTQILPFLELQNLYEHIDFTMSAYDPVNLPARQCPVSIFICPSQPWAGGPGNPGFPTNYCGIHNDVEMPIDMDQNGVLFLNSSIGFDDIRDGCSNTLYVVETKAGLSARLGWMSGTRATLRNAVVATQMERKQAADGSETVVLGGFQHHDLVYGNNTDQREAAILTRDRDYVGGPGSFHAGAFHVLMGDGAVKLIASTIDANTFRMMANRADGELIEIPY